jgi:hypothetical protein
MIDSTAKSVNCFRRNDATDGAHPACDAESHVGTLVGRKWSRRSFVSALPTALSLAACAKSSEESPGKWHAFGDRSSSVDHSAWDYFLGKYVHAASDGINRVAYSAVASADRQLLQDYLRQLQATAVNSLARLEQFALWINLYNAATVDLVVRSYPVESIREIGGVLNQGPWQKKLLSVAGSSLSLDDIEHTILRPIWKDVRIHYAVNCASLGCPNLAREAYRADRAERMLIEAAGAYVNHPRGFQELDGELVASSIYDWYEVDWGGQPQVLAHARTYATGESAAMLAAAPRIDRYDYDWSLNELR